MERLGSVQKIIDSVKTMRQFYKTNSNIEIAAVMSVEIGGLNSMCSLCVGAELNLPVVDCDLMGRAFPELQMITPTIYGELGTPCCMTDDLGNQWILMQTQNKNVHKAELFMRTNIAAMSCDGGIVGPVLSKEFLLQYGAKYTMSRIWRLGRAIVEARQKKLNPLKVIEEKENGKLIFVGKVIDVHRETKDGYNKGTLKVNGLDHFTGKVLEIEFQNENLIARLIEGEVKTVLAIVPDLISIVDCETYEPILTEEMRFGLRVSVLHLPVADVMSTEKALKLVGPQAFGLIETYQAIGKYVPTVSVLHEK